MTTVRDSPSGPEIVITSDPRPTFFQDEVVADVSITSLTPIVLLRSDLSGDPLGFDVPEQPAGSKLLLTLSGAMNNTGATADTFVQPVINGTPFGAYPVAIKCDGGGGRGVAGTWVIPLGAGTTTVRFQAWSDGGQNFGCFPSQSYAPTVLKATGIVGK